MAKESTYGTMSPVMTDTGLKTRSMAMEFTYGLMAGDTMESGKTTTCMARAFTPGGMAEGMKVSTLTTANMDSASIHGLMEDNTLANGKMENSMVMEDIDKPMAKREEAFGKMARDSNGVTKPNNDLINLIYIFPNKIYIVKIMEKTLASKQEELSLN